MAKTQSLTELIKYAIARHGYDRAWSLARLKGDTRHCKTWQAVINEPARTPEQVAKHQIWQEKIKRQLESES